MLTDREIKSLKYREKMYRKCDAENLYIEVPPNGKKRWRFKYRYNNKAKMLSLGVYPLVSLSDARKRRDEARRLLANGIDPSENRKVQKAAQSERSANSFEVVAREWFAKHSPRWAKSHSDRVIRRLELDAFPWIGERPIDDITPSELRAMVERIEKRGALETTRRILQYCGRIFRYAAATERVKNDPTIGLRDTLSPTKKTHFAAVTEPARVGELLRVIDGYQGTFPVMCALRLAPLVFVRPGELRKAKWADIDPDAQEWRYTVTKTNTQHIVPLSRQAMEILRELQPLTGNRRYVFPSARSADRPMSDNAVLSAFRRMGIPKEEMSGHGFRAMARTILDEVLHIRPDYIEHQLAHAVRDPNGRAYNRTKYLPERREMMQTWADYLDELKARNSSVNASALR